MNKFKTTIKQLPTLNNIVASSNNTKLTEEKYFGYHCIYTPEEILHAAGFTPLRLFPLNSNYYQNDCFHPRSCEFARCLLENFNNGKFDFLQGVVFSQCCDALRAVYEVLSTKITNVFYINSPSIIKYNGLPLSSDNYEFFNQEYHSFKQTITKKYKITISKQSIITSINIYQKNQRLLNKIKDYYQKNIISTSDYCHILRAGYCIRKEKHNAFLLKLLNVLDAKQYSNIAAKFDKTPILLVGGINANYNNWIYHLEKLNVQIIAEELCAFSRGITEDIITNTDNLYDYIILGCLKRNCPIKIKKNDRFKKIYNQYITCGAKGIIFMIFQYCEPQQLDYVEMKQQLIEHNIPTLIINPSINNKISTQAETRIEAFIEMVKHND